MDNSSNKLFVAVYGGAVAAVAGALAGIIGDGFFIGLTVGGSVGALVAILIPQKPRDWNDPIINVAALPPAGIAGGGIAGVACNAGWSGLIISSIVGGILGATLPALLGTLLLYRKKITENETKAKVETETGKANPNPNYKYLVLFLFIAATLIFLKLFPSLNHPTTNPLNFDSGSNSVARPSQPDNNPSVYPNIISSLNSIELGQAVLMLMPAVNQNFYDWDFLSNGNIVWQNTSYDYYSSGEGAKRIGMLRINVMGTKSTILHATKQELTWTISYSTREAPKFGVSTVEIMPGIPDGNDACFGTGFENCSFNPLPSLAMAGITTDILCKEGEITGLLLKANGKKPTLARWLTSTGSGGESSWIELLIKGDESRLCN
jgi:hypothetical protein